MILLFLSSTGNTNAKSIKMNENKIPASTLKTIFSFISSLTFTLFIFGLNLKADEPKLFLLDSIISNFELKFKTSRYTFTCKPYAILGVDDISQNDKECYDEVLKYYSLYPNDFYKVYKFLKVEQMYHIEFKNNQCIIYVRGQKTLTELLLREGLAVLEPHFMDREFEARFKKSQQLAKEKEVGIYSVNLKLKQCIYQLHVNP